MITDIFLGLLLFFVVLPLTIMIILSIIAAIIEMIEDAIEWIKHIDPLTWMVTGIIGACVLFGVVTQ
jgi:hypothetical protein